MKSKTKLIAKESSATNRDFYNLFRPIAPSIDLIGKVAQVISAATEAVTIWHICQSELAGSSKFVAILVSLIATILVVALLELGGRKFLQVATRTLVWNRFKNAWYIGLFAIVSFITIGMGVMSFRLSTNGINHAFVSNVPFVKMVDESNFKNNYREEVKLLAAQFDKEWEMIHKNHEATAVRKGNQYDSKIAAAENRAVNYDWKYAQGEKWAKSQASKYRKKVADLQLKKSDALASLQTKQNVRFEQWRAEKKSVMNEAKKELNLSLKTAVASTQKAHEAELTDATFWGGLFSWLVGFSVILAFICIISVEVFRRGSGIQVEYEEEEKEPSIFQIIYFGIKNRFGGFFRRKAEGFAKIAAPGMQQSIGFNHSRSYATGESDNAF